MARNNRESQITAADLVRGERLGRWPVCAHARSSASLRARQAKTSCRSTHGFDSGNRVSAARIDARSRNGKSTTGTPGYGPEKAMTTSGTTFATIPWRRPGFKRRKMAVSGRAKLRSRGERRSGVRGSCRAVQAIEGSRKSFKSHNHLRMQRLSRSFALPDCMECSSAGASPSQIAWNAAQQELRPPRLHGMQLSRSFALPDCMECSSAGASPSQIAWNAAQQELRPPRLHGMRLSRSFALPIRRDPSKHTDNRIIAPDAPAGQTTVA